MHTMADLSKARHSAVHAMPTLGQKLRKLVGGGGGKRSTGKEEKRGWGRRKPAEWHAPPDVFELKLDFGSLEDLEKELERGEGFWKGFDAGEVKPVAKAEKPEVKKEERVERREERRETPVTPVKRTEDRPRKSPAPARPANARYPTLTLPEAPRGRPRDFEATRSPPRAQPQQAATTFPSYRAPTTTASNRHSIADPTLLATRARQPSPAGARSVSATRPAPSQTPTLRTTPSAARLSERLSWLRELEAKNGSAGSRPAELQKLQGGVAAKLARFEGVAAQAGPQRGLVRTGSWAAGECGA
ncbi:hypothetical protein EJ06DRAFT_171147 [Trichodelitschia bisporula]|uniref:Uncharacterized protein n=1 Tax=Trichodelitschia bisporula TaxID=703511 RepID=A0A6G1HLQ2_9PEZI|nr:hypothetical protein EJ06DRAFT_171147 [Trichodelitschia bisporula]